MQSLIHAIDTLLRPWPLQLVINLSDSFSCHIIIYIPSQFKTFKSYHDEQYQATDLIMLNINCCSITNAVPASRCLGKLHSCCNFDTVWSILDYSIIRLFSMLQVDVFWCIHKTQCLHMHVPCFKSELLSCLFIW